MTRRQRDNWITPGEEERICGDEQRIGSLCEKGREGRVDVVLAADVEDMEPQPEYIRRGLQVSDLGFGNRSVRVHEHPDHHGLGNQLMQQLQLLRRELSSVEGRTRDIAARPVEAGDEAELHRIAGGREDDWNCRGCRLGGQRRGGGASQK